MAKPPRQRDRDLAVSPRRRPESERHFEARNPASISSRSRPNSPRSASSIDASNSASSSGSSISTPSSSLSSSGTLAIRLCYLRHLRLPRHGQQPGQPEVAQLFQHGVLAQAGPEVGEVDVVELLVLVEAGEDDG